MEKISARCFTPDGTGKEVALILLEKIIIR